MTEKRFTVHIKWYNYEKTKGDAELKDNGQPLLISEDIDDVRLVKNVLNDLNDENEELKQELEYYKAMIHTDTSRRCGMTNYRDEDLFNACMNFCQVFTIFLLKKQEIENNHYIDEYEKRERLRHYRGMMVSKFEHLQEVVNSIGDVE